MIGKTLEMPVRWMHGDGLPADLDQPLQLQIVLQKARMYGFQTVETPDLA